MKFNKLRARTAFVLILAAAFAIQFTSSSTSFADSNASKILSARSLNENEYLKKVPEVCLDLYGPMAVPAAKLLWKNPGPVFAMDAVTRAYGEIWALKGPLNVNERSLATVAALVAQGLYPQIKLHINGLVSSGSKLLQLYDLIGVVANETGVKVSESLVEAVLGGLKWRQESIAGFTAPTKDEVKAALQKSAASREYSSLDPREVLLARLSAEIAAGSAKEFADNKNSFDAHIKKMSQYMLELGKSLPEKIGKDDYMDLLITHLIVYCGYPKGMNAFTAWQQLRGEFGLR